MPFLHLGYKKIHYTDYKPADNASPRESFILMHGLGSSQNYYSAVVPELLKQNSRCIIFDTTGAARSPYTQVEQSIESLAGDVVGILDALSVEKAVVVGHSMGGIVASHLAATLPSRIVSAVLIGPVYPNPSIRPVFEKRIETVEAEGMESMANTIPSAATGKNASALSRALIRELLLGQDPAGYVSNCRVIVSAQKPDYAKIQVPVLIIAGDEDKSAPLEGCQKQYDEIGSSEKQLEILKGVGHWHCLEAPEKVAKLIVDFYQQIQ